MRFVFATILVVFISSASAEIKNEKEEIDYLQVVLSYANTLLDEGRDHYGEDDSPLIATTLNRKTLSLLEGENLEKVANIQREKWGIREHDRMLTGANPMHDQNLYQVLYALAQITEESRYAREADKTLKWFFEHCQSEKTGLFAWGEHIGWDFYTETLIDKKAKVTHEFFRPWILWRRSFELAPEACAKFAEGLWDHQIGDQETGNFSRHARWDEHGPGLNSEYPRHGGFYIATWATAYKYTGNPVFSRAIKTLLDYFNSRRHPVTGAVPAESAERSKGQIVWVESNLSLAIDLQNGSTSVLDCLAAEMRMSAARTDVVFLSIPHDLSPGGKGFVKTVRTATLEPENAYADQWVTGYGDQTEARMANLCLLRYEQTELPEYKDLALKAATRYLSSEPEMDYPVYPGSMGDAIYLLVSVYEITGEEKYLNRAQYFARRSIDLFLDDDSPLPRATSRHDHYEAITGADTLMMSLVKLWAAVNKPDLDLSLVYCER